MDEIHWRDASAAEAGRRRLGSRQPIRRVVWVGVLVLAASIATVAFAAWLGFGSGSGAASAQAVNTGNQPTVQASGSSVTVSWSASTLSGGGSVTGYQVKRYNSSDVLQTIGANCAGTVAGLTCTETGVPNGTWKYSVTPVRGAWSGVESPKTSVTVSLPSVTSTSPSSLPQGATGQAVTVAGSGFVNGATVSFSGSGIAVNSTTFNSSTQLTANVTISGSATTGARNVTVTNPDGGVGSCTGCFTVNARPVVTSTSPSSRGQGATAQDVTVVGSNFVNGATVSFSGSGITINGSPTFVDSSHLTVNLTIASGATTGARNVTVTNPDTGTGSCTGCFTVNAGPTVASTNPSSRGQGAVSQSVTVTGTNFVSGASTSFSGTGITVNSTTFNTSTQLTANITISGSATTGARNVTVTNPDAGTGSCAGCFSVTAGPNPTSVNPSALDQGGSRSITINGTSFQTGAAVAFTPSTGITLGPLTVTSTTITATATIAAGAPLGARDVTVTNPDQGTATCAGCFTVQGTPTVTSVDPAAMDRGGTQNVTITGTNFVNGTLTSSFGAGVTVNSTTYVSATQATANLTVAGAAATGSRSVTVTNSDGTTTPACTCFTVQAVPTVTSVSPAVGDQGGSNPSVTIAGTDFVVGPMTATFSGTGVTATSVVATSSTQATATVTVTLSAATGSRNITITNSDGTSASHNGVFTVQGPPTVTSTSPALGQGATSQNVTINGTNFVGDTSPVITPSVAFASGVTVNTVTYNATNKLTANVTVSQSAPVGAQTVTVTNPDGTTASGSFTVNAGPKPTSVTPNTAGQGATSKSITITGTGFQTGGGNVTVTFSGSGVSSTTATNTASSATSITLTINVASNADLGLHNVIVTNKTDHGSGTCTGCLTVDAAPQFAATNPVSPTSGVHSTTITMTINGTGFDPNVGITFSKGGFVINTKSVNGSGTVITLNVTLPGGTGGTNITLLNPDGGTSTLTSGFTVT